MKRTTIDLDEELYRRLRIYCAERNLTMAEVIRKQLEEVLGKAGKKKSKS
jgi:macrodomain Ter protein organizer (MatP/YcbG family)